MPLNLIFTQAGTFTIDDNGIPGDNTSVIRDGNGVVIFTFLHPADALGFTVSTPGVNLIINFTDSMGAADFSIGDLANSAITPDSIVMKSVRTTGDVTLVSNGAITEGGSDAATDIVAGTLIMSAVDGVGTSGNAIETQTGLMEVETTTGGINIRNTGSVQIGGLTDQVNGLDVLTSGNLTFTAIGSIFLSDLDLDAGTNPPNPPPQSVHGGNTSGNVTLTASGVLSDIITNTDTDAITAPRGNITVNAGRDVAFGTIGVDFDNDVRANGTVLVNAGRDFLIDGFSDLSSDDFFNNTGGDVVINTGRNIHVRDIAGSDATITASGSAGGKVVFTTGFSGGVILDAPSASTVNSSSGDVIVNADRMLINSSSGITANSGQVTLRPATEGRAMFLGSASDAALAVELADSELDRIFTSQLIVGSETAGLVRIIAPFSPANTPDLVILSGTDISIESSFSVVDALTLRAGNDIFQLGATLITTGGVFRAFVDDVQDDGDLGGTGIFRGAITSSSTAINGNLDADTLEGTDGNDVLQGLGGNDTLRGRAGADDLDGGTGADHMTGGLGDDDFDVDSSGDVVVEAVGEGNDTVKSSVSLTLADNVENLVLTGSSNLNANGNSLDNVIFGNTGNNTINGKAGADTMKGDLGNDIYVVDNAGDSVTETGTGIDLVQSSVTFTLGAKIENLTLIGGAAINGTGNTLANILTGNGDNNTLNGGTDADTMIGGLGNDIYVVDNAGDVVTETGAGIDTVQSTITFTLGANFENLTLIGGAAINGTGNGLANILTGNNANNILAGLGGNDIYVVGNAGDVVTENPGEGTDLVQSSITFTLGANVENLTLIGGASVSGTGNTLANILTGNGDNNTLNGGTGADTMIGGLGNDIYVVDNAGDIVTELVGQGTDIVQADVTYTIANHIENLTLTGVGNINGTGNGLANTLLGNTANNILDGKADADTMKGGTGDDTYVVDNVGDIITEILGQGTDIAQASVTYTIVKHVENLTLTGVDHIDGTGNGLDNTLLGNAGKNILSGLGGNDQIFGGNGNDDLFGGAGNDELTGGAGLDEFRFDFALNAATNVDDILDFSVADDTIFLDRDVFTGIAADGKLAATAFVNGAAAGDIDDRIIYNSATGNIFYDADGSAGAAQTLFATVTAGTALTNSDFFAFV